MNSLKSMIWKPSPEEQRRKCNSLIRSNTRKLDRDIQQLKLVENKTKTFIVQANKRGQKNPSQQKQAAQETRKFAKELLRVRKQNARLATSKAQLHSVQMQVNEAFSVRKIAGSLKSSTGIVKDVNTLIKLPELSGTMRELSQELVKAGILEEMIEDSLPSDEIEEDDELADAEVSKVLDDVLKGRLPQETVPQEPEQAEAAPAQATTEEEDQEELLQMQGRLEALKS